MPAAVFDGMPDAFIQAFGEPVTYTPASGAPKLIESIWTETSDDVVIGDHAASDTARTTLSVRAEDVTPAEGDTATRVADGKTMTVTTPIQPDGKGMIRCNLAEMS